MMKRIKYKMVLIFLTLFFLLSLGSLAHGTGDIICNYDNKRYDTPDECVPECKVSLKNPMGGCFLSPQCGRIPNDKTLKSFYNQAIFLRGPVRRPYSYIALVNYIIDKIIDSPDVKSKELNVQIGDFGCFFYMQLTDDPKGGKYPLLINKKSFFQLSPAYLILAIIHEIQHLCQFKRVDPSTGKKIFRSNEFLSPNHQCFTLFNDLVHAFEELEVSYYETQSGFIDCLTDKEKKEVKWREDYWEWKVKETIQNIVDISSRCPDIIIQTGIWLKSNVWTWGHWLPQNPNWRIYKADPNNYPGDPQQCP